MILGVLQTCSATLLWEIVADLALPYQHAVCLSQQRQALRTTLSRAGLGASVRVSCYSHATTVDRLLLLLEFASLAAMDAALVTTR
jgi:hypothetical protein